MVSMQCLGPREIHRNQFFYNLVCVERSTRNQGEGACLLCTCRLPQS